MFQYINLINVVKIMMKNYAHKRILMISWCVQCCQVPRFKKKSVELRHFTREGIYCWGHTDFGSMHLHICMILYIYINENLSKWVECATTFGNVHLSVLRIYIIYIFNHICICMILYLLMKLFPSESNVRVSTACHSVHLLNILNDWQLAA